MLHFKEIVKKITAALNEADGDTIAEIYNLLHGEHIVYLGNSEWEYDTDDEEPLDDEFEVEDY